MRMESTVDLTDEALIDKYREEQDMALFKILVRRHQGRVFAVAYRLLGSSEEAEEIVQDCFVKVHQNLHKYRAHSTFSSWLLRICQNLCMDALRMRHRRKDIAAISFDPQAHGPEDENSGPGKPVTQVADAGPGPSQNLDQEEQTRIIEESIQRLPENQKIVLVLHDIQGLSYQQIADQVGTSIGTVRSRLHYGRLKLKEILDPYFSPENRTQPLKSR